MKRIALLLAAPLMASMVVIAAPASQAAGGRFDNCTNYNQRFPHGVGRAHAHDHTSGTPVRNFHHSTRLYRVAMRHNSDLDRDKDGIACEKA